MLTRGILIGKIVDDLALLKYQIESRNRLGQFDLSKFCEDFFKNVLNIVNGFSLINLNLERDNNPGLDLGDKKNKVAYQITSQRTSAKINDTLSAISAQQQQEYTNIRIFIIGEKQGSYSGLDPQLSKNFSFTENNIEDMNSLLKQIVTSDIDLLDQLYNLFLREFRQIKIDLEPIDSSGNFESSIYNVLEKKPASPPKNAQKYIQDPSSSSDDPVFKDINKLYKKLAGVPRSTREVLAVIIERGKYRAFWGKKKFVILPKMLEKLLRFTEKELKSEIDILEEAGLVDLEEDADKPLLCLVVQGQTASELFHWIQEETDISIRTLLTLMNFTVLDN